MAALFSGLSSMWDEMNGGRESGEFMQPLFRDRHRALYRAASCLPAMEVRWLRESIPPTDR